MELVYGVKYSKVTAGVIDSRAWRSAKKMASGYMRRRRKLVGGITRRVMLWGSGQLQLKKQDQAKTKRNLSYDILGYTNNFDDGKWKQEEADFYSHRSFSFRFVQPILDDLDNF